MRVCAFTMTEDPKMKLYRILTENRSLLSMLPSLLNPGEAILGTGNNEGDQTSRLAQVGPHLCLLSWHNYHDFVAILILWLRYSLYQ